MLKPSLQLAFDDVWLEPQYSEISSRADPKLTSHLSEWISLSHPVIASNMSSVVGSNMADVFASTGGIAIHHRFQTSDDLNELSISTMKRHHDHRLFAFSIGVKDEDYEIAQRIYDNVGICGIILVDIAHGHTHKLGKFLEKVSKIGYAAVIAGNVATADGYRYLVDHGADSVRVGVAGGKVCTTKNITGHHVPTLQSVLECAEARIMSKNINSSIIADGGIRDSGDANKAIAAGADFVCIGGLLASTSAAPSELINKDGKDYKLYYGMSSRAAMDKFFAGKKTHVTPEGKSELIPYTGDTLEFLLDFIGGIQAGLSYSGAMNIKEYHEKAILRYKQT